MINIKEAQLIARNASKPARKFKEAMADQKDLAMIMTDMTGQYDKVVGAAL